MQSEYWVHDSCAMDSLGANCCSLMSTAKKLSHYFVVTGKKSTFPFSFLINQRTWEQICILEK